VLSVVSDIRVVLQRAGEDIVRIKGFLVIFKCTSACALLAHFRSFATYALPKVASWVQIRCFVPYLQPSFSALESYTFISVEHFHGAEMLREGPQSSLPPQTSYYFLPRSSPLLIGPAYYPPIHGVLTAAAACNYLLCMVDMC
jgi:hypothetical protein